jgi:predicted transposase/invertase (TIGR01784 family)
MTELAFTFTHDTLFKMVFVNHPDLLQQMVSIMLCIPLDSITEFEIRNPEIPPESLGDKFCRLDINMTVNGKRVDIEVQVADEKDYSERSLYYWAREYSTALPAGHSYTELPEVIVISIVDFPLFDCEEYFSRYQLLEVERHTLLTDKLDMRYYELGKVPEVVDAQNEEQLVLAVFKAKTEEELKRLDEMGAPIVKQAIRAYREVVVSPEFREAERLRSLARHNEASALLNAERRGAALADAKWQVVVADQAAALADQAAALADKDAVLADKDAVLADQAAALADKDAEIARLRALLDGSKQ